MYLLIFSLDLQKKNRKKKINRLLIKKRSTNFLVSLYDTLLFVHKSRHINRYYMMKEVIVVVNWSNMTKKLWRW